MKKGLIITAIVLVVLILIYFGVKGVFLYNYNGTLIEDDTYLVNFKKELAKNETVSITHTDLTSEETYYDYEDISFRNDYLNCTTEIIGNEDETKIVNFKAGEDILLSVQKNAGAFGITTEFKEILDEENISNDIEIMKYIVNNYNKNLNIFSSIKNFEKIRAYMRDFYVYGFKSRDDFKFKSARSYDDERRRIESWLGDNMSFVRTPEGKNVFISIVIIIILSSI